MVEQIDSEEYADWIRNNETNTLEKSPALYQKPVLTKTWFHTGAYLDRERILTHFKNEYWYEEYNKQFPDASLSVPEPELSDAQFSEDIKNLPEDEYREAVRACKGIILRQEIFALDAPEHPSDNELKRQMKPYSVQTHTSNVQLLQPRGSNEYGVFIVTESEAITIHYERDETDYRIEHTLNTRIDELGNIIESASVVYGRRQEKADADFQILSDTITDFSEDVLDNDAAQKTQLHNAFTHNIQEANNRQTHTLVIYTRNSFSKYNNGITDVDDIDLPHAYRLRLPYETKTYELTGFTPAGTLFIPAELENALLLAAETGYHESPGAGMKSRLIEHIKTRYFNDNLDAAEFGFFDTSGLLYESYQLAYTPDLVTKIYSNQDETMLQADGDAVIDLIGPKGNYVVIDGNFWIRSGITHFKVNPGEPAVHIRERFFSPVAFEDPFGSATIVTYDTETFSGTTRNNDGYYLYIKELTDAVDNKVQIGRFHYRTMSPSRMIDINANPTSVVLDELGLVKAMAIEGNGGYTGEAPDEVIILKAADNLIHITEYTGESEKAAIDQFFGACTNNSTDTTGLTLAGNTLLKGASLRFIYDFDTFKETGTMPAVTASISREEHFADNNNNAIRFHFEYTDGLGNLAMTKVQAEPGLAFYMEDGLLHEKDTSPDLRWAGTGRTVMNNKGNPVKQYEPYFSTNFLYETAPQLIEIGVSPVLFYDPPGRLIKTEFPDGTLSRFEFNSWKQINFDQNDTVLEMVMTYKYDMLGHRVYKNSMDAGERWMLNDIAGNPVLTWDSRDHVLSYVYDALRRPLAIKVQGGDGTAPLDNIYERNIYGEGQPDEYLNNLRGQIYLLYDTAGRIRNSRFDFKGNVLESSREINADYKGIPDWVPANLDNTALIDTDLGIYTTLFTYDAQNRTISTITPDAGPV